MYDRFLCPPHWPRQCTWSIVHARHLTYCGLWRTQGRMYSTILFASWLQHHSIYFWQRVEDSFLAPLLHLLGLLFTMSSLRFLNYGQLFLFWFFLVDLRTSRWPRWGLRMKHLKGKTCAVSYCIPLLWWLTWSLQFCFYIRDASEDRICNTGNETLSAQYQQTFITIRIHKC